MHEPKGLLLMGHKIFKTHDLNRKAAQAQNMPPLQPISGTDVSLDKDAFRSCRLPFSNPSSSYQLLPKHSSAASLEAAWACTGLSTACTPRHYCIEVHQHSSRLCFCPSPSSLLMAGWISPNQAGFEAFLDCSDSFICPTKSALSCRLGAWGGGGNSFKN